MLQRDLVNKISVVNVLCQYSYLVNIHCYEINLWEHTAIPSMASPSFQSLNSGMFTMEVKSVLFKRMLFIYIREVSVFECGLTRLQVVQSVAYWCDWTFGIRRKPRSEQHIPMAEGELNLEYMNSGYRAISSFFQPYLYTRSFVRVVFLFP